MATSNMLYQDNMALHSSSPVNSSNREATQLGSSSPYSQRKNGASPSNSIGGNFQTGKRTYQSRPPEERVPFLQVPTYQGHSYIDRSYDYMRKYPPDVQGKELDPDSRTWKVYLDESEIYDTDMVKGFRDTIDALLVFAALFSSVVAGFAIETSQALEPNYGLINANLLFEQNQLLRAAGNTTQIRATPKSQLGPDSATHSSIDIWVNFMFFSSLALSLATALLAILVKQWLQVRRQMNLSSLIHIPAVIYHAYTCDAKERSLIRQFRFAGLERWKLREIISILPLFLHFALGLFLAGLALFVYDFHPSIRYAIISIAGTSFALYFSTAALPAIWLDCPYRQPILYIPARIAIYPVQALRSALSHRFSWLGSQTRPSFPSSPLYSQEQNYVSKSTQKLESSSLSWLFMQTTNTSVQRIAIHGMALFLSKYVCRHNNRSAPSRDYVSALSLEKMSGFAVRLFRPGTYLEDAQRLVDLLLHTSHVSRSLLPPLFSVWRSAIQSPHLQLFLDYDIGRMDAIAEPVAGKPNWNPLLLACRLGRWEAAKSILPLSLPSHLASLDAQGLTPLGHASRSSTISHEDWVTIIELTRRQGIDLNKHRVNDKGETVLHVVCRLGKVDAALYLFSTVENLDCNVQNIRGETPLHVPFGCQLDNLASIVNILLDHGADLRVCARNGLSALHYACNADCAPEIVKALCISESGRKCVNRCDTRRRTPLHDALDPINRRNSRELLEVVQILFESGADVNITDYEGNTALHYVCMPSWTHHPSSEVIEELFGRIRNFNSISKAGQTPLDVLGSHERNKAICEWMRQRGALPAGEFGPDVISANHSVVPGPSQSSPAYVDMEVW